MISQEFLDRVECLEDVVYKRVKGLDMKLDLYRAKGGPAAPSPVLLLLHGGGWFRQDKKHEVVERFLNAEGARVILEDGWQIAAVEYRMLKDHAEFPDQLRDCCDAARYLIRNAGRYAIDPRNLFVGGSSAGGYAAVMMASETAKWTEDPELAGVEVRPAAVVSFSGVLDVEWIVKSGDRKVDETGDGRIRYCMQCLLSHQRLHDEALWKESSPRSYLHSGSAPALIIYGTADSLVTPDHAAALYREAKGMGLDWEELAVRNAEHNFAPATAEEPTVPSAAGVYAAARDFLLRHRR